MVLFLFAVMLLNLNKTKRIRPSRFSLFAAVFSGGALLLVFVAAIKKHSVNIVPAQLNSDFGTIRSLGKILFNDFILPFELSSILFLSAMIGAIILIKKDTDKPMNTINSTLQTIPLNWYIIVSMALFCVGITGIIYRRNAIVLIMCIELMLNAGNLLLTAFSAYNGNPEGQVLYFLLW